MMTPELMASIRSLIGADAQTVPDSLINDPLIAGVVKRQIEDYLGAPPYAQRPADEQERIGEAAAYLVAAKLLGTRELRMASAAESEKFGDQYTVTHSVDALDIDTWRADLESVGMQLLGPLRRRGRAKSMFATASGRRGA